MCLCLGCGGVGGIGGEWVRVSTRAWKCGVVVCMCELRVLCRWEVQVSVYCADMEPWNTKCYIFRIYFKCRSLFNHLYIACDN